MENIITVIYTFVDADLDRQYPSYTHHFEKNSWNVSHKPFDILSRIYASEYLYDIDPTRVIEWDQLMFYINDNFFPLDPKAILSNLYQNVNNVNNVNINVVIKSPIETIGYPALFIQEKLEKDEKEEAPFYFWANVDNINNANTSDLTDQLLIGLTGFDKNYNTIYKNVYVREMTDLENIKINDMCKKRVDFLLSYYKLKLNI